MRDSFKNLLNKKAPHSSRLAILFPLIFLLISTASLHAEDQGFEQFLNWEETANIPKFTEPTTPVDLPVVAVPFDSAEINSLSDLPTSIQNRFFRKNEIFWPIHLYNLSEGVPYFDRPVQEKWQVRLTASRSVVMWEKDQQLAYSIKLPTDHPHPSVQQSTKTELQEDIGNAILRSQHIQKIDQELGPDSDLIVLPEILTVAEKLSKNGFILRDLRPLLDGHYYLPAFSIPWVGREIAKKNGEDFEPFWKKNYAELVGRSKAKLLIRYGLQMQTPNAQNMLIQLDGQMRPTGKLVFRDISDTDFVEGIAKAIGEYEAISQEHSRRAEVAYRINPRTSLSFWQFDSANELSVSMETLTRWTAAHNEAYVAEALHLLGFQPDSLRESKIQTILELETFLFSNQGKSLLTGSHSKRKTFKPVQILMEYNQPYFLE